MALIVELDDGKQIDIMSCMEKDTHKMTSMEIKACINQLLYNPEWQSELGAVDREQLNMVVTREKMKDFDFLHGFTKWHTVGTWRKVSPSGKIIKEFPNEENAQVEIEFKDRKDEKVGERIINLFGEYNRRVVGEDLLYVYTQPIEESSL